MIMKDKNNKVLVIVLVIIVVVLAVLCVLFATGKISFTSKANNEVKKEAYNEEENNLDSNLDDNSKEEETVKTKSVSKVYSGYSNVSSSLLVLFTDDKFSKCEKNECLGGSYSTVNNQLTLVTDSTEEYPTSMTYVYNMQSTNGEVYLKSSNQSQYIDLKQFGTKNVSKVYYGIFSSNNISYSTSLVLYEDNTFSMSERYSSLEGKYTIANNKLTLVTDSTEEYPNSMTYSYDMQSANDENNLIASDTSKYANLKEVK